MPSAFNAMYRLNIFIKETCEKEVKVEIVEMENNGKTSNENTKGSNSILNHTEFNINSFRNIRRLSGINQENNQNAENLELSNRIIASQKN